MPLPNNRTTLEAQKRSIEELYRLVGALEARIIKLSVAVTALKLQQQEKGK
jgi:hypothetical protein